MTRFTPDFFAAALSIVAVAGDTSMHFLSLGDWGGSSDTHPTTSSELANSEGMAEVAKRFGGVRFVLAQGDNFYSSGIHGDDHCSRFASGFEQAYPQPELNVPWYAIAGNHDHGGNVSAQVAYTLDSKRWRYPNFWYTFTEHFTTDQGHNITTQVVQIDTVTISGMSDEDPDRSVFHAHPMQEKYDQQMQWLEQTLAESTADYLWVGGHYPMYSHCQHGPTSKLITGVLPLMQKYGASGFIAGHDHCLGHFQKDGMAFVLSGAGKGCCYSPRNLDNSKNVAELKFRMDSQMRHGARAGFTSFTVAWNETIVTYHDHAGNVLFSADGIKPRNRKVQIV